MDRLKLEGPRPLQIRSGHTPVNLGLLLGSLAASVPAIAAESTRSKVVGSIFPEWALYLFYVVLLVGAAVALSATWRQLPSQLTPHSYRVIVSRLVRERIGHYAVAGIMICFSISALSQNGWGSLSAPCWLLGIAGGLLFRARQTHVDVRKLHAAVDGIADQRSASVVAEPDDKT